MNAILIGSPGSGKGTVAKSYIAENKKYNLITTGDIFREERNNPKSELGKLINETLGQGKLIPDDVTNKIVINKLNSSKGPYLFDGYPRTKNQAEFLDENSDVDVAIYLEVTDKVVIERIIKRGETSGRDDDKDIKIINKRLEEYKRETQPLVDYYKSKGILHIIDAEMAPEKVLSEFKKILTK